MENSESQQLVIAPGFKDDCDRILRKFEDSDDRSFKGFCEIWRMMKFAQVYWNRTSEAEMLGFCEEALDIAKEFISPSNNEIQRMGGVFLLYGLYFKCPIKRTKIRLTMAEWGNLLKHRDHLFTNKKFEAVYVLNKLIESHAFAFCIREQERGLENYYVLKDVMKENTKPDYSQKKSNEITSILTEIASISESYIKTKSELIKNSTGIVPKLYNGLEIPRLLSAIESINNSEGKKRKKERKTNFNDNLINDSSSPESDDDDEDFDPDMS